MGIIASEIKDEVRVVVFDVVRLVDGPDITQCSRELLALVEATKEQHILLHFGRVAFMSSAALGMLVRMHKKCQEFGISLKLCNISPEISQVFKITGLDKVFSIYPDSSDAMQAFKKGGGMFFRKQKETRYKIN